MKINIILLASMLAISGCSSSKPPICNNKAKIGNSVYDIPVFKKEDGRYLAGYPFYTWADKADFVDTEACDKLNP